ncbi:MAG: HU family DNA-binding protein [Tannerella sp.]|jgi:nucleoid DNA-binding protein|nr:HU family DNA-binding protein [Tannerella sp.]
MNDILTSQHLVDILVGKTRRDRTEVETFFEELVTLVCEGVINEQAVEIKGIGAFKVRLTKERTSLDPHTQETVIIPPHHKLAFVPTESFGKRVNRQFESFPSESRVMEGALPADLHLPAGDEEETEEEITDHKKTETMEDQYYSMPPVPSRVPERTEAGETASANEELAGGQQPEVTGEETQYAGGFGEEKPDEETQLLSCSLESSRDDETQYAGSFGEEKPDEETQLLGCSLESSRDDETQLLGFPLEAKSLRDEETQYAGDFGEEKPDDETQLLGITPENTREEETQLVGNSREEPALPTDRIFSDTNAGPKTPPFNPTQIALAIVLLLVLGGGIWYLFATRGFGLFHRDQSGWISGESFALPGDSAALEQARQKANVASEIDSGIGAFAAATDSLFPAADTTAEYTSSQPKPEKATKKTVTNSGKKTSSSRKGTSASTKAPAASASSGKTLAKVTMSPGSRLTLLALKYYGDKIFWVYIYDFNKAKIGSNPDLVPAGMEILVPAKEVYGIDANDADSREKARQQQAKIKGDSKVQ